MFLGLKIMPACHYNIFTQSKLSWMRLPLSRNPIVILCGAILLAVSTLLSATAAHSGSWSGLRRTAAVPADAMSTLRSAGYLRVALAGLEADK
jgi:hypothetical protein